MSTEFRFQLSMKSPVSYKKTPGFFFNFHKTSADPKRLCTRTTISEMVYEARACVNVHE